MKNLFGYSFENPWFFTNFSFLLALGIFLILYSLLFNKVLFRKIYLILFSLFFYYKSSGPFIAIFLLLIICDYNFAHYIERFQSKKTKKILLVSSIILSLTFLIYFKYSNFFLSTINNSFNTSFALSELFLPIGISFYTFQSISYIVDVYNSKINSSKSFLDYTFYMTFFPHLVAGPIVRASDFIPQINYPAQLEENQYKSGLFRILIGLGKKLLIADFLSKYVDMVHTNPKLYSGVENLISMYAYSCQIYFDFSGYSDIAIGIAILLGYQLKENFDNPYHSKNITAFWRTWHISLSTWLRDYIYIPLGGSRNGKFKTYLFLFITMTIGGFWHGASWNFVLWGIAHGVALIFHKLFLTNKSCSDTKSHWMIDFFKVFITFNFVSLLWILFRASNFDFASASFIRIFNDFRWRDFISFYLARKELVYLLITSFVIIFATKKIKSILHHRFKASPSFLILIFIILFLQAILQFRDTEIAPFIYFQF